MRVLVVVGSNLKINTSANLCHKAYIQGLLENGYHVDILTVGYENDNDLLGFDKERVDIFRYPMESLYEKIGKKINSHSKNGSQQSMNNGGYSGQDATKSGIIQSAKRFIHSLYGPYEVYISWERKAFAFRREEKYDLAISLSFPPVSHHLLYRLIQKKHIETKKWIQIWEDPWCQDLVFLSLNDEKAIKKAQAEEAHLLQVAEKIVYVSPITLEHQSKMFHESSKKMTWYPVPTYYVNDTPTREKMNSVYGYFGDYSTKIRNLKPFYEAAKKERIVTNICGSSDKMFLSSENVSVRPRISLEELKPIEDETSVLVFLSNLHGGQIPGKIYQYSATEKTILFILDGSEDEQKVLLEYFGKFKRYFFCKNTVEDISAAIRRIEKGEVRDIVDRPLTCFSPKEIVGELISNTEE
jgi:hypothetical protein